MAEDTSKVINVHIDNIKTVEVNNIGGESTAAISQIEYINPLDISIDNSDDITDNPVIEKETILNNNSDFIEPSKYYATLITENTSNPEEGGYLKYTHMTGKIGDVYFWVEDLHNWCRYIVDCTSYQFTNLFQLTVWNGKDGWCPLYNFFIKDIHDSYNIRKLHNFFAKKLIGNNLSNAVIQHRGCCHGTKSPIILEPRIDKPENTSLHFQEFLQTVEAFKLISNATYTINEPGTFQAIRWSSMIQQLTEFYQYSTMNSRVGISTGIPPIFRLPTGDIALCSVLKWGSDNGYDYEWKPQINEDGTISYYKSTASCGGIEKKSGYSWSNGMIGYDNNAAANFINSVCKNFFGDGSTKTIKDDWLQEKVISSSDTSSSVNYLDMLDSTKTHEQQNNNVINTLKCKFTPIRPTVTTEESVYDDYVRKF